MKGSKRRRGERGGGGKGRGRRRRGEDWINGGRVKEGAGKAN